MIGKKIKFNPINLLITLSVILMLTVACSGAASESMAPAGESSANRVAPEAPVEYAAEDGAGNADVGGDALADASVQAQMTRVIIYTGNLSLVVRDTEEAMRAITDLAAEQGGHIASSNIYQYDQVPRGSITIRVPAESYQDTLIRLQELAVRVESESTNTQDVTEEFVDLDARKTNLEFAEAALQKLLEERQRVGSTSDILEVHRELTNIRGQIEQIEGRLRYLSNQAALSTITIELIPDVLSQPVSVAGWQPQGIAREALQALIIALQGLAGLLIWFVIFLLPLLVVLLIPVVIVIWLIRWIWRRYKARKGPLVQPPVAAEGANPE